MKINIIAVGGLKEDHLRQGCEEYLKRISAYAQAELTQIQEYKIPNDPKPAEVQKALEAEGQQIMQKIPRKAFVISLCVEGKQFSSPDFASVIEEGAQKGTLCFIIGGSYGLSEKVKAASDIKLSFSQFTFPHQLMRVLLLEQLYRALNIRAGGKYHK